MAQSTEYYGKYRGVVVNNIDPLQIGRLLVQVPDVFGSTPSSWAMPCMPLAGRQMGAYLIPTIGSNVWVEFEQGDSDYPVWVGCWWETAADVPARALAAPPTVQQIVIQTPNQNTVLISDVPGPTGGLLLKTSSGAFISVNDTGLTLSSGKGATLTLAGNTVDVNQGTLLIVGDTLRCVPHLVRQLWRCIRGGFRTWR